MEEFCPHQSAEQNKTIKSINQSIDQSIEQSINQSINRSSVRAKKKTRSISTDRVDEKCPKYGQTFSGGMLWGRNCTTKGWKTATVRDCVLPDNVFLSMSLVMSARWLEIPACEKCPILSSIGRGLQVPLCWWTQNGVMGNWTHCPTAESRCNRPWWRFPLVGPRTGSRYQFHLKTYGKNN